MVQTMGKGSLGASSSTCGGKSKSKAAPKGKSAKSVTQTRKKIIYGRPIQPEHGIDTKALKETTLPRLIDRLDWEEVADQQLLYNPDVVKDFYTALVPARFLTTGKVKVHGREVIIIAEKINDYFEQDDYEYEDGIPQLELFTKCNPRLAAELRMEENYLWDPSGAPLKHAQLTLEAAFFNTFCTYSVNPAEHYSTLFDKNARLIYCLLHGINFHLGKVMVQIMCDASDATKKKSVLPFLGVISHFCNEAGIPVFEDPTQWHACRPPFNATTYNHLASKRGPTQLPTAYVRRRERAGQRRHRVDERELAPNREGLEENSVNPDDATLRIKNSSGSDIPQWAVAILAGQQTIIAGQEAISKRLDGIEETLRRQRGDE